MPVLFGARSPSGGGPALDWYLAPEHKCVHYMKVKMNLSNHVIPAQMGWSEAAVEKMVATYAPTEIGALDAIDAAVRSCDDRSP